MRCLPSIVPWLQRAPAANGLVRQPPPTSRTWPRHRDFAALSTVRASGRGDPLDVFGLGGNCWKCRRQGGFQLPEANRMTAAGERVTPNDSCPPPPPPPPPAGPDSAGRPRPSGRADPGFMTGAWFRLCRVGRVGVLAGQSHLDGICRLPCSEPSAGRRKRPSNRSSGRFRRSAARNRPLPAAVRPSQHIGNPKCDCPGVLRSGLPSDQPRTQAGAAGTKPPDSRFRGNDGNHARRPPR